MKTVNSFQTSTLRNRWLRHSIASPSSICGIYFQLVNFRAAFENGDILDAHIIRDTAQKLDSKLETWRASVPSSWRYEIIDVTTPVGFNGKHHLYPSLWVAEVWNTWRALRISVNQILVQNELRFSEPDNIQNTIGVDTIRQLSTDICISTLSFVGSPRKSSAYCD